MKWQAALYQCIYKYEFWNVFIWASDDELQPTLITVSAILLTTATECTKITPLVIYFSRSNNKIPGDFQYFQELQTPCFLGVKNARGCRDVFSLICTKKSIVCWLFNVVELVTPVQKELVFGFASQVQWRNQIRIISYLLEVQRLAYDADHLVYTNNDNDNNNNLLFFSSFLRTEISMDCFSQSLEATACAAALLYSTSLLPPLAPCMHSTLSSRRPHSQRTVISVLHAVGGQSVPAWHGAMHGWPQLTRGDGQGWEHRRHSPYNIICSIVSTNHSHISYAVSIYTVSGRKWCHFILRL